MARNVVEYFLGQVPVRINQAHAVAELDVLDDQIAQKRRFPRTRLANDVDVLALVHLGNAKRQGMTPAVTFTDDNVD